MKFTLGWLKEHLDTDASLNEITDKLTSLGLELEGVEDRAKVFAPFKVAYVEKAEKHPDADRLKVCIVDTGSEKIQVVCGAPNARTGMKGVFAPDGSYIPGTDTVLKKGVIRGQESCGMLVSEREMGLSDDHDGIIEVAGDVPLGTPFAQLYGMDDPVIDVAITPDRADCTGVRGIARDLAAAGLGTLKPLKYASPVKGSFKSPINVTLKFDSESANACPHFIGRYIKGVKNGTSPDWMQKRLKAIGLRPISALVDITNYVTHDLCRPLHVFDADKIKGDIHVRLAKTGETLDALNDKSYTLDDQMTAVCDDSGVLGLGGIVGGASTGCEHDTTNVFLEAAYFDPYRTAKTGRALDVISDARYRFERGIDPAFTQPGIEFSTQLIQEICGGEVSDLVVAGAAPDTSRTIDFDPAYTEKLGGITVEAKTQEAILTALGFELKNGKASVPSWRGDVEGKADLVEEVIRVIGLDKIEAVSVRPDGLPASAETPSITRARLARTALAARGMCESVTWSFMPKALAASFGSNDNAALTLTNPISSDLDQMRPSILPNLLQAVGRNADRGYGDTALFEVGPVFESAKIDGQRLVAAGLRHGNMAPRHWTGAATARAVDTFDAKADALAALAAAGAPVGNLQISRDAPDHFHPGRSGSLRLGANVLGYFGEIHPAILDDMGIDSAASGFEVFLDNIPEAKKKGTAKPLLTLSALQPVERDFAFIVDEQVEAESITRAARGADKKFITAADVFDIYQGKGVEEGKKSVAIAVTLQPIDQTLTDAEIDGIAKKIVDMVCSKTGATLRS
jgi:phenylalanyl-tRNA synthetase beta chain